MKDRNFNNLKELEVFVRNTFPDSKGALLTGSFATKNIKKNSDIDLIIFSDSITKSFVEKIKINSQKIDLIYLSTHFNYLLKELYLDINSRYGVFANMISTSKILFDKNNFLKELIFFSKNIILKEYGNISSVEIDFKRKLISNAIEDIEDTDSFGEFYFSSSLIIEEITNLILSYKTSTIGRGKNKARELEKVDPEFYLNMLNSIKKGDKKKFIKDIKNKLDFFGGVLDTYSSKDTPSIELESNDFKQYEIIFNRRYINYNFTSLDLFKITSFFQQIKIKLLYYQFCYEQIIIKIELENLNQNKIKHITNWLISYFKIEINDRVVLRTSKTKLAPFVSKQINECFEKDLIYLTNLIINKKIFFNNDLESFSFGKQLIKNLISLFSINDRKKILNYIYISNLLDTDGLDFIKQNYFQLIEDRNRIVDKIEIYNETLSIPYMELKKYDVFFDNLCLPKKILESKNNELNILEKNFLFDNNININAAFLLLNIYIKNIFDLVNNNKLSLTAYNLNDNI